MRLQRQGKHEPPVIVSITPLPIKADSRTFKQANSLARLGYRSIVVEGPRSNISKDGLLFELISSLLAVEIAEASPLADPVQVAIPRVHPILANEACDNPDECPHIKEFSLSRVVHLQSFRKRFRQAVDHMTGSSRLSNFLWLGEYKSKQAGKLLTNCIYKALNSFYNLFKFCVNMVFHPIKTFRICRNYDGNWVSLIIYRFLVRVIGVNNAAFLRHFHQYIKLYTLAPLRVTPRASLYYLHAFYQFPAVYLLCLRYRAKFVYDAHDFYSNMHIEGKLSLFWRNWVRPFENWIEHRCAKRAVALVTVNESIAKLMEQRFGKPVTVLRNSHDMRLDGKLTDTIRDAIDINSDAFLTVCIGNWKEGAAINEAIDALTSLPAKFHLAFLGAGYPSYQEILAEKNLSGRVHILTAVAPSNIVPFIRTANASIILYHAGVVGNELSLPNRFFQSIGAGLPLLYPRLPEIRRVAEDYDLGIAIDPLEPASIAQGIRALAEDYALHAQKRANVVSAQFALSWERDEEILRELIDCVIKGSNTGEVHLKGLSSNSLSDIRP